MRNKTNKNFRQACQDGTKEVKNHDQKLKKQASILVWGLLGLVFKKANKVGRFGKTKGIGNF